MSQYISYRQPNECLVNVLEDTCGHFIVVPITNITQIVLYKNNSKQFNTQYIFLIFGNSYYTYLSLSC